MGMTFEHLLSGVFTGFVLQLPWVNILVIQGVLGDAVLNVWYQYSSNGPLALMVGLGDVLHSLGL